MYDRQNFTSLRKPYIHLISCKSQDANDFIIDMLKEQEKEISIRVINGDNCTTSDKLFKEFAKTFNFPDYFGENWAAFDECINDLDWIGADAYILLVKQTDQILKDDNDNFRIFIKILLSTVEEWTKGRDYDSFPTPPTPFNIIFLCSKDEINKTEMKLKKFGIQSINKINIF
ncbi:barstar family protein [Wukongibacter baidiensis]|uniref:barstar family protein n=1 Tax=Wukongibacter baidiensis TaxID=1723361 RepID=UPI003D7FE4FB